MPSIGSLGTGLSFFPLTMVNELSLSLKSIFCERF